MEISCSPSAGDRLLIGGERRPRSRPTVQALHNWLEAQLPRVAGRSTLAEADPLRALALEGLRRFLQDGRIELDTNPVERAIRSVALGRKNYLFAGSDGGGESWAITIYRAGDVGFTSELHSITDSNQTSRHVGFVPNSDVGDAGRTNKEPPADRLPIAGLSVSTWWPKCQNRNIANLFEVSLTASTNKATYWRFARYEVIGSWIRSGYRASARPIAPCSRPAT